jgi:hypothetical protein
MPPRSQQAAPTGWFDVRVYPLVAVFTGITQKSSIASSTQQEEKAPNKDEVFSHAGEDHSPVPLSGDKRLAGFPTVCLSVVGWIASAVFWLFRLSHEGGLCWEGGIPISSISTSQRILAFSIWSYGPSCTVVSMSQGGGLTGAPLH